MAENRWENEGGNTSEEPYDDAGDREPRIPKSPNKSGGAELEIPKEEELFCA